MGGKVPGWQTFDKWLNATLFATSSLRLVPVVATVPGSPSFESVQIVVVIQEHTFLLPTIL